MKSLVLLVLVLFMCKTAQAFVTRESCKAKEGRELGIKAYGHKLSRDDQTTPFYEVRAALLLLSCIFSVSSIGIKDRRQQN